MDSDRRATARIHLWSLSEDVLVEEDAAAARTLVITKWAEVELNGVDDAVLESLRRMTLGPVSLANALAHGDDDGSGHWTNVRRVLDQLSGSVVRSLALSDGERPLLSAVPVSRNAFLELVEIPHDRPVRLSRFAAIRTSGTDLVVESPLAQFDVVLHRPLARYAITGLAGVVTIATLAGGLHALPGAVADMVAYLVAAGVVVVGDQLEPDGKASFAEDRDPVLSRWSHHELLFHVRSRMGRYGGPSGAVFPHAERFPSPGLVKVFRTGDKIPLYRPDLSELIFSDPPLTQVLENARLCSDVTGRRLSAEQVGELLYRAARVRAIGSEHAGAAVSYDVSDRPYLSTSGLYELELYVCLHNCADLPRGIFHYDPVEHTLTMVNDSAKELAELLDGAKVAARITAQPPMVITVTARIARASWMYGGIGYSLTLAHVGALQQTLSLVANAMGLAACAPAIDPGDIVDNALRLDSPAEVGVGEFVVG